MNRSLFAVLLSAPLVLVACDQKPATPPVVPPANTHAHAGEEHGEEISLGSQKTGAVEISAVIGKGFEKAGEAHVEVKVTGVPAPVVRAWIGAQDGAGSVKAKLGTEEDHFHGHVEVPSPLPAQAQLWVEVEGAPAVGFGVEAAR